MGFKETLEKEKLDLQEVKRPYETAAFILFALLFLQNIFLIIMEVVSYIKNNFFSIANMCSRLNNAGFITRISNEFSGTPWFQFILGIVLIALYFAVLYFLVFNYCRKRKLAKWTWLVLIAYGPTIFLAPIYIWFAIYVFRPYIFRFIKRGVEEYKNFDPKHIFEEELPEKETPVKNKKEVVVEEPEKEQVETEKYE